MCALAAREEEPEGGEQPAPEEERGQSAVKGELERRRGWGARPEAGEGRGQAASKGEVGRRRVCVDLLVAGKAPFRPGSFNGVHAVTEDRVGGDARERDARDGQTQARTFVL